MIIWLASYPRSGNTIVRMILKSVFGQGTYSKYNDPADIGADQKTMELVGHKILEDSWENAYQKMKQSDQLFFVKTHDYPEDDSKAIYIAREGCSSIVSYWHYLKDFVGKEYQLSDVIAGFVNYDSWGGHLDAWNPISRTNTLLTHYERLLTNPDEEIEKIASFLGLSIVGDWKNDFEYFHMINPRFFREGHAVKGIKAIKGKDLDLFWMFHGDWMETLDYSKQEDERKNNAHLLREITQHMHKRFEPIEANRNLLRAERDKLRAERDKLRAERDKLRAERDELLKSLSWKITAPARSILRFIKGGREE